MATDQLNDVLAYAGAQGDEYAPPLPSDSVSSHAMTDVASEDDDEPWCLICLSTPIVDRTVLPTCSHSQFCFQCILRWADVKRKCPLCQTGIGAYVIHSIRGDRDQDYIRYHLRPKPDSPNVLADASVSSPTYLSRRAVVERVQAARRRRSLRRHTPSSPNANGDETSELERALSFRRSIYAPRHLYARHVGANRHTGHKACPSAAVINRTLTVDPNGSLRRRMSAFIRRELQVWPDIDQDFVTTYVLALTRILPMKSDESVNLLAEFIGHANAAHFWHELECFLRSGKMELRNYDSSPFLQYGNAVHTSNDTQPSLADTLLSTPTTNASASVTPSRSDSVSLRRKILLARLKAEKAHLAQRLKKHA